MQKRYCCFLGKQLSFFSTRFFYAPDTRYLLPSLPAFLTVSSYGLAKVYDRLSARSLNGYDFDRQLPKLFATFCVLMIVIPSLLTGYLFVEPRHNLQDPDKLMVLWLEDSTPENSVIVAGADKHIMYYCQKGSQRTSIHIIHASRDPSPILDYVLKGYPVFAVLDATTQALYASDFDAFKQRFNLIFVELVPATNIAVFRVYQKT